MTDPVILVRDLLVAATMLTGTFLMVVTGIGLIRFPDVYCRMHAAGKAGTTGVSLLIFGAAVFFVGSEPMVGVRGLLAIVFPCLTSPGATYLLAHACYVTNYDLHDHTGLDELREWLPVVPDEESGHE